MKYLKYGYPLFGAVAAVAILAGCADENPWGNSSEEQGSISVSLKTDSSIATAKPVFRSGEDDETRASNDLKDYITLPSVDDFVITLTNSSGREVENCKYSEFKTKIQTEKYAADIYTLTASIQGVDPDETVATGQEHSKNGFNCYCFEGSTTFTVIPNRTTEIDLTAELKKSMVRINFDDSFIKYVEPGFSACVRNSNDPDTISFVKDENRVAFIDATTAVLSAKFTTKATGKTQTANVKIGEFQAVAKTLHNVTLAIDTTKNGFASLIVNFDETVGNDDVNVDLTNDLYETPAPEFTCTGFSNGDIIDLSRTHADKLGISVYAAGKIKSATLTIQTNESYTPAWGNNLDLCGATTAQQQSLSTAGITVKNLYGNRDQYGSIEFNDLTFGNLLPDGRHTVLFQVTDSNNKVSDVKFIIKSEIEATFNNAESSIIYGSGKAAVALEYNGNPNDITFTATGTDNTQVKATISGTPTQKAPTRVSVLPTKTYLYNIEIPNSTKSTIDIIAYNGSTPLDTITVPVTVPEYRITQTDAYNNYAYLQITTPGLNNTAVLTAITNNIAITNNGSPLNITGRDASAGILTVTGLEPATTYTVKASITGINDNWNVSKTVKTEAETAIPNGKFSQKEKTLTSASNKTLNVGGEWHASAVKNWQHTSSFSYEIPSSWATINDLTAYDNSSNYNTWYVVPSSWMKDGEGVMRSVGYNHQGRQLNNTGSAWSYDYYCTDHPSESELKKAAGELFLGSYSFDGTERRTEGIVFESRPQSISFKYTYTLKNEVADQGYALVNLLDSQNNSLGKETYKLDPGSDTKTIPFKYEMFGNKAVKLIISFKSSTNGTPPIHIPTGSELDEKTKKEGTNLPANTYKAVATGSELRISNVVATYWENTNSVPTPKAKTIKRK